MPPHIHPQPKVSSEGALRLPPRESWHAPEARLARACALSEAAAAGTQRGPAALPLQAAALALGAAGRRRGAGGSRVQGPGR